MTWRPRTYEDAVRTRLPAARRSGRLDWRDRELRALERDAAPDLALPQKPIGDTGDAHVKCPGCGIWTHPWALVDVRGFPGDLTRGQAWACPGCWETWLRDKKITRARWLEFHGAPATLIAKVQGG